MFAGQAHDAREEEFGGAVLEQVVLVLAEGGVVPDGVQQVEVEEPAEEEMLVEGLDQQHFGTNGVEGLQQLGLKQAFGRDGGAAQLGIHLVEERGEVAQDFVHKDFDLAQRVVLGHAARGREQALRRAAVRDWPPRNGRCCPTRAAGKAGCRALVVRAAEIDGLIMRSFRVLRRVAQSRTALVLLHLVKV